MPKIPPTKSKKFYYRRVSGLQGDESLEERLREAHSQFTTVGQRTFDTTHGGQIKAANFVDKTNVGLLFHIAAYVPGQPTSTVSKSPRAKKSKVDAEPAPEGKDYLDGDVFVLVKEDHIILCPSGVRESAAEVYIRKILTKKGVETECLEMEKVAKVSKVKMIKEEGVKEIRLGASLYEASLMEVDESAPNILGIKRILADQIERLFAEDPDLDEIRERENLNIEIVIKFDGRNARKHQKDIGYGESGRNRLMKTSDKLLRESDAGEDGFVIVTNSNNEIRSEDIRVSDTFRVKTLGKSLSPSDAWARLEEYANQLEQSGVFAK